MKYYVLAATVLFSGALAVWHSQRNHVSKVEPTVKSWKVTAVEPETAVRPARFEEMKWTPEAAVELRSPASTKKKK